VKGKDGKEFKVTKGAPQVILALVDDAGVKDAVDKAVDEFAARGFRSLGVAKAEGDGKWQFIGVLPLFDPPRDDAKATIAAALKMGVTVKMVTGDALAIAQETAKKLGMGTNILDASSLGDVKKEENKTITTLIEKADGFAQVFPEHKFHIVDVLQKHGHIVGMTGDGVNDAPALKKADCGIAVSGATDAARAAAAIVLLTPGLSVVIDAIKESRRIFQRMNSYAIYRIAETLRVLLFMTSAILVFNFYPLTAVMIVMLALLNDGAILSIAYDNVRYRDQPEAWDMRTVLGIATALGVIGPIAAFGLFYLGDRVFHLDRPHVQTLMYLMLSVAGHLTIFLSRTRGPFWSIRPAKILLVAVFGTQALATLIAVYGLFMTPLGWKWAGFVWAYALVWFLINDGLKLVAYKVLDATKGVVKPKITATAKPEDKAEPDAEAKNKPQPAAEPQAKAEPKPEDKAMAKPDGNAKPEVGVEPKSDTAEQPEPEAAAPPEADDRNKPKPQPAVEPQAKADPKSDDKAVVKPDGNAKPEVEDKPKSETVEQPRQGDAAPAEADAKDKPQPQPVVEPETAPKPDAKTAISTLLDTTLGDVLLAGIVKDPGAAGRIIAEALSPAETPADKAEPKSEDKATTPAVALPTSSKSTTPQVSDDDAPKGVKK
jgi:H+-transporting ATPase